MTYPPPVQFLCDVCNLPRDRRRLAKAMRKKSELSLRGPVRQSRRMAYRNVAKGDGPRLTAKGSSIFAATRKQSATSLVRLVFGGVFGGALICFPVTRCLPLRFLLATAIYLSIDLELLLALTVIWLFRLSFHEMESRA
jgi:hypothetical protein